MANRRSTHEEREQQVLTDVETNFPNFAGRDICVWTKVPEGFDPPDFLSSGPTKRIGLELVEWLDGNQMGPAKGREAQRADLRRVLFGPKLEMVPENIYCATLVPNWGVRLRTADESLFRDELVACITAVDQAWQKERNGIFKTVGHPEFAKYPTLGKYLGSIRFRKGGIRGFFIDVLQDGGPFDPNVAVETLEQALDKKIQLYSQPDTRAKLNLHRLSEFYLLVHGGFNAHAYNTPGGHLSLEEIARRGSTYLANHPLAKDFSRVWFYDSLDCADDVNELLGFRSGAGRVRWLCELWPDFDVYPGSVG